MSLSCFVFLLFCLFLLVAGDPRQPASTVLRCSLCLSPSLSCPLLLLLLHRSVFFSGVRLCCLFFLLLALPCALCLFCGGCAWGVLLSFGLLLAKRVCSGVQVLQLASCIFFPPSSCRLLVVVSSVYQVTSVFGSGSGLCAHARAYAYLRTLGIGCSFLRVFWLESLVGLELFCPLPFLPFQSPWLMPKLVAAAASRRQKMANKHAQYELG